MAARLFADPVLLRPTRGEVFLPDLIPWKRCAPSYRHAVPVNFRAGFSKTSRSSGAVSLFQTNQTFKNMTIISKTTLILLTPLAFVSCKKETATTAEAEAPAAEETAAVKPYPLDVCIVSGEELGSMGDPIVINHEGQEIKFCCDSCVPKFKEDPDKYLGKLDSSAE